MAKAYLYSLTDTWDSAGTTFNAIKMNVTDTASAAGSLLMDLQVGGGSKFSVLKNGAIFAFFAQINGSSNTGVDLNYVRAGLSLGSAGNLNWTNGLPGSGTADTILARDAANTLAQRNGTNAQAFRVYNTYTDASNYERFSVGFNAGTVQVRQEHAGSGSVRAMYFGNADLGNVFGLAPAGGLLWVTDNTYDIGASGASRPRNLYVGGYLSIGDGITAPGAGTGQARIYVDTADGDLKIIFADGTIKTIVTDT